VKVVLDYLRLDLLAWLFIAVVLYRTYLILLDRVAPSLLWDGLAFAGVTYFVAYQVLAMFTAYYLAPVDVIAVLYVGRLIMLSWGKMLSWSKVAISMLAFAVLLQDVSLSTFAAFERKNDIAAKVKVASVLKTRHESEPSKVLRLFFPFASPYVIMEFAFYLEHRGVPLNYVALATRTIAKDSPCVAWFGDPKCYSVKAPAAGDLVIVLPEDLAWLAEASVYRKRGELLFSYEPRPRMPQWLCPLIGSFPLAAGNHQTRPDRWMDASVTLWK
jgi:hypothetical protein